MHDVGPTYMNQIMHYCFKEIHLKRRDLNGKNQFGQSVRLSHCYAAVLIRRITVLVRLFFRLFRKGSQLENKEAQEIRKKKQNWRKRSARQG